jgi:hypothetical protein
MPPTSDQIRETLKAYREGERPFRAALNRLGITEAEFEHLVEAYHLAYTVEDLERDRETLKRLEDRGILPQLTKEVVAMNPHDPKIVEVVDRIYRHEIDNAQAMHILGISYDDLLHILDAHGMLLTPEDIEHDVQVLREFDMKHPPQPTSTGVFGWIGRVFRRSA